MERDDLEFLNIFNEYYPFERYIFMEPKSINFLFDDAKLIELFVPSTEIKPITDDNSKLMTWTKINEDNVYVKIKGPADEMRFNYFDFADHIRENIRNMFVGDFGEYEYEGLYVEHEKEDEDLKNKLIQQRELILEKYGTCNIKETANTHLLN